MRIVLRILFSLIFVLLFLSCKKDENNSGVPNTGTIQGQVTNKAGNVVVGDETITTSPTTDSVKTDAQGKFLISNLSSGQYTATASKIDHLPGSENVLVTAGQTADADIRMRQIVETWNMSSEYSTTNNPTGVWSYGRKWSADAGSFDLMTVRWGASGWYFGNVGHGGPSIQAGPILWAKNNSNGLPVVRWTSPRSGLYRVNSTFRGNDSRGVDVLVYIAVNNSVVFTDTGKSNLDSTRYSLPVIQMTQNAHLDFLIKWNGGVYSEYRWTKAMAVIDRFED